MLVFLLVCACLPTAAPSGVCKFSHWVSKTRTRTFLRTHTVSEWVRCGWYSVNKYCVNYRTQSYVTYGTETYLDRESEEECCPGYRAARLYPLACRPVCDPTCVNADCAGPGECVCKPGYAREAPARCRPDCPAGCRGGTCVAPDDCRCGEGRWPVEGECRPLCSLECFNGTCTAPDVCTCDPGHVAEPSSPNVCVPVCSEECVNAACSAPETCSCFPGYTASGNGSVCEPLCSQPCANGFCSAPDVCSCLAGYRSDDGSSECRPLCSLECENGECVGPEECACLEGYRPSEDPYPYLCHPFCSEECVNANCTAPDTCTCLEGHAFPENGTSECDPVCSLPCANGTCTAPDVCHCDPGYGSEGPGSACRPLCSSDCGNGTCTAPDVCTCRPGYSAGPGGSCAPVCSDCGNGTCAAPGECSCPPGYEEPGCRPRCPRACAHGACVRPRVCACHPGFALHPLDPELCLPDLAAAAPSPPLPDLPSLFSLSFSSLEAASIALRRDCGSLLGISDRLCAESRCEGGLYFRCGFLASPRSRNVVLCGYADAPLGGGEDSGLDSDLEESTDGTGPSVHFLVPSAFGSAAPGSCALCFSSPPTPLFAADSSVLLVPCDPEKSGRVAGWGADFFWIMGALIVVSALVGSSWIVYRKKRIKNRKQLIPPGREAVAETEN